MLATEKLELGEFDAVVADVLLEVDAAGRLAKSLLKAR
jgi:hypothetical protein